MEDVDAVETFDEVIADTTGEAWPSFMA